LLSILGGANSFLLASPGKFKTKATFKSPVSHAPESEDHVRTSLKVNVVRPECVNSAERAVNWPRNRFLFGVQLRTDLRRPQQKNGIVIVPIRFDTPGSHAFN
jgi:hypothetical protein